MNKSLKSVSRSPSYAMRPFLPVTLLQRTRRFSQPLLGLGLSGLNVLVNNVGVLFKYAHVDSVTSALATNFEGVVRTTLVFEPLLRARSTVLTTSSSGGTRFMASLNEA